MLVHVASFSGTSNKREMSSSGVRLYTSRVEQENSQSVVASPSWPRGSEEMASAGNNTVALTFLLTIRFSQFHHWNSEGILDGHREPRGKSQIKSASCPSRESFQVASREAPGKYIKLGEAKQVWAQGCRPLNGKSNIPELKKERHSRVKS